MGNQYDGILPNYHVDQYLQAYEAGGKAIHDPRIRVRILGESRTVQETVSELFYLPQYRWPNCLTAPLPLTLCIGPEKKYWLMKDGEQAACSEDEFFHCRTAEQSLEENAPKLHGGIVLTAGIPDGMEITALDVEDTEHLDDILLDTDICVLAMSATRVLSLVERSILNHPMNTAKICLLKDLQRLPSEADRQEVSSLVEAALNGAGTLYCLPLQEEAQLLFQGWMKLEETAQAREERWKQKYLPQIQKGVEKAKKDAFQARKKVEKVETACQKFPNFKAQARRRIKAYCVDNIKTDADSKFLMFFEQMNRDIAEGIGEENDIKALQEQLPNFIAGEWNHFLEDDLKPGLHSEITKAVPQILSYIQESSEETLQQLLTPGEIENLRKIRNENGALVFRKGSADGIAVDGCFPGETGSALCNALPKCMMALGGIVFLSGGLLSGAILLSAGISSNGNVKEEAKTELISAGKQLNTQYFNRSKTCTEEFSSDAMETVDTLLDEVCEQTIVAMRQIKETYQQEVAQITAQIEKADAALDELQK